MPRLLILIPFILFVFSCTDKSDKDLMDISSHISAIKSKYVPDKRTSYFIAEAGRKNEEIILRGETTMPQAKLELIRKIDTAGIPYIDSLVVLPHPILDGNHFGIVNVSVCNIRSKPKHSAELGTQALLGTPLRVWKKEGDFYFIQTPDDYFGWLDDGGLKLMNEKEYEDWQNSEKAVCLGDSDFLLEKANSNSNKVSDLIAGGIMRLIGYEDKYVHLSFPDNRSGFILKNRITPYLEWKKNHKPNSENILATAHDFLGRPYLWGGTSGKGVDCSGFTKTVYYLNGIQLERDASLQVNTGELIETDTMTWKNLLPGDLLFFGRHSTKEKKERISHVAIYMGDGKIIHSSDRVKIESLRRGDPSYVDYRVKSFIRAKRMIGSEGKNGVVALKDSQWY